jgi:hypothetical protein
MIMHSAMFNGDSVQYQRILSLLSHLLVVFHLLLSVTAIDNLYEKSNRSINYEVEISKTREGGYLV